MGVVYLAEDVHLKRKVALKVLAPELAQDPRFRERFVRESQLAASLDHPNIIPIYEAREAGPSLYIAMRYVPGLDLMGLVGQEGPLPPERTISILGQAASALDAAHAQGLIHRDVKPGSVVNFGPKTYKHTAALNYVLQQSAPSGGVVPVTGVAHFVKTKDGLWRWFITDGCDFPLRRD
jgi:Protein kinase domain